MGRLTNNHLHFNRIGAPSCRSRCLLLDCSSALPALESHHSRLRFRKSEARATLMIVFRLTRLSVMMVAVQIFVGCAISAESVEHSSRRASLCDSATQQRANLTETALAFWAAYGDPLPLIGSSKVSHTSAVEFQTGIVAERFELPVLQGPALSRAAQFAELAHRSFPTQTPLRI